MSNPFKTKEFKVLFVEWNRNLEASGLKEIEDFSLNDPTLKDWHGSNWAHKSSDKILETQFYYDQACDFLRTYKFESATHKRIWRLHCAGMSCRKIALYLDRRFFSKSTIHQIIFNIRIAARLKSG